jgi:hypothetical protein
MSWQRLLIALLACVGPVFAGPILRVSLHVDAKNGSGLIAQAYRTALRNTPGVVLVAEDQTWDVQLQIECDQLQLENGPKTGYAWAEVLVDYSELNVSGPRLMVTGKITRVFSTQQRPTSSLWTTSSSISAKMCLRIRLNEGLPLVACGQHCFAQAAKISGKNPRNRSQGPIRALNTFQGGTTLVLSNPPASFHFLSLLSKQIAFA